MLLEVHVLTPARKNSIRKHDNMQEKQESRNQQVDEKETPDCDNNAQNTRNILL